MKKNNKGFVVSAVLYPLLVLFLALIMGFLSMSDTRKRILDKMKLEISDSIFDEATCSCDTILNSIEKLRKDIAGISFGGGGNIPGQVVTTDIKVSGYETESELPLTCTKNEIAVVTSTEITNYYLAATAPVNPNEGTVWIVQDNTSKYFLETEDSKIGVSYAMQYEGGKWQLKKAYLCTDKWTLLYYVDDTEETQNVQTIYNYEYTGEYQEFRAPFAGYYLIELWGAKGGTVSSAGGNGAYTYGTIYLKAGQGLYVYVGGAGSSTTAGWNGGGAGGSYGGGGGGATDVRLLETSSKTIWSDFESLKSRIMVAAGGGGGSYGTGGGTGGSLTGNNGGTYRYSGDYSGTAGIGGTQSLAGFLNGNPTAGLGGFGYAGNRAGGNGGGGGGGYYGGGGATSSTTTVHSGGGGGGGSSYISGHEGCNSITESSITTDIVHTGLSYHYSGYYFINTSMEAGNNSGNGKAKISLKSVEVKDEEELEEEQKNTQTRWNFTYAGATATSGKSQIFTVPEDGLYKIELWGAKGGTVSSAGGNGAYTTGTIYLTKGLNLYIYVGGIGYSTAGGWNGGGAGGSYGGGGGGATDIRLIGTAQSTTWDNFNSLKTRIMVAAGGGGGSYGTGGGTGGSLTGNNGGTYRYSGDYSGTAGIGGTQSLAGFLNGNPTAGLGGFGYGGNRAGGNGGGGGGGYYGGGGATSNTTTVHSGGGGGGGSSYISGSEKSNSIANSSTEYSILHNGSRYHYSGYYFESTTMLTGSEIMPNPNDTNTMTGNSGAGHARITQLSKETKTLETLKQEIYDSETTWDYTYSGANHTDGRYQLFTVPKDGTYSVQLWGGSGGTNHQTPGYGAYTYGEIYMNAGEKYYLYVGGKGYNTIAGWNGGGNGNSYGGGGGGATDIRLLETSDLSFWNDFESLKTRIMVAAGGGGGSYNVVGGAAGSLSGNNGGTYAYSSDYSATAGLGATQSLPGYLNNNPSTSLGGFGFAGNRIGGNGAGGGGGYYGGGGATSSSVNTYSGGSGGGGSSYISGYEGCNSISESSTSSNIIHTGSIYHYSTYFFTEPKISAGNESVPSPKSSSAMTGNNDDGYARITLLKEEKKDRSELYKNAKNNENLWQYNYSGTTRLSGTYQTFTPSQDGKYKIELWGAQGGGNGAYTAGEIYLTKGVTLYIYVGGRNIGTSGGWNGGGNGNSYGTGGGGATDVRLTNSPLLNVWNNFESLKSRIMVAAGGGGSSYSTAGGGAGGSLTGNNGGTYRYNGDYSGTAGIGATEALPGYLSGNPTLGVGDFGIGGNRAGGNGGGGGGGYYGGGGGTSSTTTVHSGGGGGGGTSYISGYIGCNSIEEESEADNIIHNGSAYHYSGYYFDTTAMLAGNEIMPSPTSGGTITGKTNDGYAKVTLLKKETKTLDTLKKEIIEDEYKWVYTYSGNNHTTGRYQVFNVPKTGTYSIQLWGAQGGGLGSYTYGEITLNKDEQLYVYVGGFGLSSNAGWNGGGIGGSYGVGGGGATDIRTKVTTDLNLWNEATPLKSRIMVAAGGGGSSYSTAGGGAAGGLTGYNGGTYRYNGDYSGTAGIGATQIAGGYLNGSPTNTTGLGGFGYGGNRVGGNGGGGGGGWYGGGGATSSSTTVHSGGGGGGGSSYISGHEGCIAITSAGSPKVQTYSKLSDSISHTGYTFVNTQMIDGAGYPWTTVKSGATSGMPSPTGILTQTGQAGDGYAIIHYLGE